MGDGVNDRDLRSRSPGPLALYGLPSVVKDDPHRCEQG